MATEEWDVFHLEYEEHLEGKSIELCLSSGYEGHLEGKRIELCLSLGR